MEDKTTPTKAQITVVIPYHSNTHGLAVTLALLQAQVVPPERIVVIDTSKDKSGLAICRRYHTNEVPIVVEHKECHIYEAWNIGIEFAKENTHILFINDDLLLPINTIDIMSWVGEKLPQALCITAETPARDHYSPNVDLDGKFNFYAPFPPQPTDVELTKWMPGFFFMLTKRAIKEVGKFDSQFKVWFGDDDMELRLHKHAAESKDTLYSIVKLKNIFVYHYGGTSYKYEPNSEVSKLIAKDRDLFRAKYYQKSPAGGDQKPAETKKVVTPTKTTKTPPNRLSKPKKKNGKKR